MDRKAIKDKLDLDSNYLGDTKVLHLTTAYKIIDELFDELEKEKEIYANDYFLGILSKGGCFTHAFSNGLKVKVQGSHKKANG